MKLWYFPYELYPHRDVNRLSSGRLSSGRREGFLVRVQTATIEAGYADCHPLVEFGDGNRETLLKRLKEKKLTPLLKRALHLAKVDGKAREEKKSLFNPDIKVRSHYTCTDAKDLTASVLENLYAQGFRTIKVKVGRDIERETLVINRLHMGTQLRWRFDLNAGDGKTFLKRLDPEIFTRLDFIEDPMPYNKKKWEELSARFGVAFAFDHPIGAGRAVYPGIRVLKPAREAVMPRQVDVLTSSMDHALGQSFAFWCAQTAVKKFRVQKWDYGLQTDHLFQSNPFFDEIRPKGAYFSPSIGYGIGFNDLLERCEWIPV